MDKKVYLTILEDKKSSANDLLGKVIPYVEKFTLMFSQCIQEIYKTDDDFNVKTLRAILMYINFKNGFTDCKREPTKQEPICDILDLIRNRNIFGLIKESRKLITFLPFKNSEVNELNIYLISCVVKDKFTFLPILSMFTFMMMEWLEMELPSF
jgi:hypothetical protein